MVIPRIGIVLAAVLGGTIGLSGCGGRERSNPFDPLNPSTGGQPGGVLALGACGQVEILWDNLEMRDLSGIEVWRASGVGGASPGSLLTPTALAAQATRFIDTNAVNDRDYLYTVRFLFSDGEGADLKPVTAAAGEALPWAIHPCGWGLSQLTPDGRRVRGFALDGGPVLDLDVDPANHILLAPIIDTGELLILDARDGSIQRSFTVPGASCVSWNGRLEVMAVGAFYEQAVWWLDREGGLLREIALSGHVEDVALRDSTTTWVALYEGDLLRIDFGSGQVFSVLDSLGRAVALADDPEGDGCWVADRAGGEVLYAGDVVHRSATGLLIEPRDLAPTGSGECWVADRGAGDLILLDRTCTERERISGVGGVTGVTVDTTTGTLWVALPKEAEVLRILPDRTVIRTRVQGCPQKVVGDWTGGCAP